MVISSRGKPQWLKIRPPVPENFAKVKEIIQKLGLHTVCQEAHCPNTSECWSGGTATFMIMGDTCTRGCRFCAVNTSARGQSLDPSEPRKLALAVKAFNLNYVVITSVNRDDLEDQGAGHFAECINQLKIQSPEIHVEVLIPDFQSRKELIQKIVEAKPTVVAHNIETVKRLQRKIRDRRANYEQSLSVLWYVKEMNRKIITKSSMMLGLGETDEELFQTFEDLRSVQVDILTLGQYLRPSDWHLPVEEYVTLERFEFLKKEAEKFGFIYVASGPFVRSSYRAGEFFVKSLIK